MLDAVAAAQRRYRWNINLLSLLGAAAAFVALRLPRARVEPDTSGWREADAASYAHVRERIASVDASSFTPWDVIREITERRAKPLLLRGAMKTWPQAAAWRNRDAFLAKHGDVEVGVGVGVRMSSMALGDGLVHSWRGPGAEPAAPEPAAAAALRERFRAQVDQGDEPSLPLRDVARHVRDGSLPHDSYAFAAVDDKPIALDVPQVMAVWERLARGPLAGPGKVVDGTLLGLGGNGSGVLFHKHEFTLSGVFAGRKRWFIYDSNRTGGTWIDDAFREAKRADPAFDGLDSMATFARALYPATAFQRTWARAGYECVQGPNDLLYVPKEYSHATLNYGETLSIALQGARLAPPPPPKLLK